MRKSAKLLNADIAAVLAKTRRGGSRKSKKSPYEVKTDRLKALRERMASALGDDAWLDTDLASLEEWFSVDDDLSDREWIQAAQTQLLDASVLPEHAGAPPPNVYAWNDAFISTYLMNIDEGLGHEAAIDSARQNANDSVELTRNEREMINMDPKLYKNR